MTQASILTLSDSELKEQFGEHIAYEVLVANAQKYRDEILGILNSGRGKELKPLLHKGDTIKSRIHRGNIWMAFGDMQRAINEYSQVQKGEEGFDEAQFKLLKSTLSNPNNQQNVLARMIQHANNISNTSSFHDISCLFIGDILYKSGKKQEALEWYLKGSTGSSPDSAIAQSLVAQVSQEIEVISLEDGRLVFIKGKTYKLTPVFLEDIEYLKDDYEKIPYTISLSDNNTSHDYARGRCTFLAQTQEEVHAIKGEGYYVSLDELDILIRSRKVIFYGLNTKGELLFKEERAKTKNRVNFSNNGVYTVSLREAQISVRIKDDGDDEGKHKDLLVFESGDGEVIIIGYDENHPSRLLEEGCELAKDHDYAEALACWEKIEKGSAEYPIAQSNIALYYFQRYQRNYDETDLQLAQEYSERGDDHNLIDTIHRAL